MGVYLFNVEQGGDFCLEVSCSAFVQGDGTFILDSGCAHRDDGAFYALGRLDDTSAGTGYSVCSHNSFGVESFLQHCQ
jgi:hypothetical protein